MSDLFLGIADPEFWRNCGYALLAIGLIGAVAVILLLDRRRRLQKGLALLFIAVVLAGLGVARFGNNALLSEARERAREAEVELAKLKTPRTLTPEGQRRVAAMLQKFAGQEFEGQVAPGSEDARPLWEELDQALRAANWVRVAPSGLAVGDPPAGIPLSPNSGVTVFVAASRANELAPTAHAVAAALMSEGIIAGVTASAGPRMEQRPNVIVVEIGAPRTRCIPLPRLAPQRPLPRLRGREREGACDKIDARVLTPSPTLPRRREREQTESAGRVDSTSHESAAGRPFISPPSRDRGRARARGWRGASPPAG